MLYEVRTLELVRPAPRISVRFRTKRGETLDELAERWRGINAEVEKALVTVAPPPATPDGDRMPKNEGEHIRQYVGWFYRTHTKATSVRALAKEHHRLRHQEIFEKDGDCRCWRAADGTFVAPDDRPMIYVGNRRAKAVLALDVISADSDTN